LAGVAFTGLDKIGEPLYPIVSSTASESELGLGTRGCQYLSLQEKCFQAIKRHLVYNETYSECIDCLPLPKIMKAHLSGDDDVSLPKNHSTGRRGVAGTLMVEKMTGAAAEQGASLISCKERY
jgi:hypothetical protein